MTFASSLLYAIKIFLSRNSRGTEKSSGQRSIVGAVICIGVSLIPLVAVLSVSNGMISGITGRMINLSSRDIQVTVDSGSEYAKSEEKFLQLGDRLSGLDCVMKNYPEVQGMALAAGNSFRSGATLRAVEKNIFTDNQYFSSFFDFVEGTGDLSGTRNAVIGKKLAETLGLHAGDSIKLIMIKSGTQNLAPKVSIFTVTGIVSCGYQELDALWVFVPLENAFTTFRNCSLEYFIGLETNQTFSSELDSILSDVRIKLLSDPDCRNFSVESWKNVNADQFENFASTRALLIVIMLAIILAASINISSAIVMVVMERRKEIAILKSTGASSSGITLSFVMTGLFTGLTGIAIGVPLGILVSVFINPLIKHLEGIVNFVLGIFHGGQLKFLDPAFYLQEIPVVIPWLEIVLIIACTIILSVLMSILPSLKAGKSSVIEILNKN
ncbi:ABC transporter permease [Treponema sp.]|uniref:ABC transporter permease n=1 Tax=Treponema sp. TaxID=166 RepID=UPI00298E71CF|nr:FtsX-like permease family protein [Treponema sp.]MCQ2241085.1 ABC transporter permease [Treponema sp.]